MAVYFICLTLLREMVLQVRDSMILSDMAFRSPKEIYFGKVCH